MKFIAYTLIAVVLLLGYVIYQLNFSETNGNLGFDAYPQPTGVVLPNPTDGAATSSTSGTLANDTYYFKITSVDYAGGQTNPSSEFTCVVAGSNNSCTVTLTPTTGAASTRLWVSTVSGTYTGYLTATSSVNVATTSSLTTATMSQVNTAYYFNSLLEVDNTWLKSYATADTAVKVGAGIVHSVTFSPSDAAATAGTIAILDSTSSGNGTTTIYYLTAAYHEPQTVILDQVFTNGIYVDFTTTNDVNVSVSYK